MSVCVWVMSKGMTGMCMVLLVYGCMGMVVYMGVWWVWVWIYMGNE